jgi:hypothetical protein
MNTKELTAFVQGYIACALWSSTDEDGDSLDQYDESDLSDDTLSEMESDCADFIEANASLLEQSGLSAEQAGHDFWLTRNRHGAGFWDRGLGKVGEQLTEAAHVYGETGLLVGDDGKLYA